MTDDVRGVPTEAKPPPREGVGCGANAYDAGNTTYSHQERGFAWNTAGAWTPTVLLGYKSMSKDGFHRFECNEGYRCPVDECGRVFDGKKGLSLHYAHAHDAPLRATHECANCGASFKVRLSRDSKAKYCSEECRNAHRTSENNPNWQGGGVTISCKQCENEYSVRPAKESETSFCSRECLFEWMSETFLGEKNPFWNGGVVPYGSGFTKRKKERVRESQDRRCAGCGAHESGLSRKLDVHHLRKARTFSDDSKRNDESNLVALCPPCHAKWEMMSPLRPQTTN